MPPQPDHAHRRRHQDLSGRSIPTPIGTHRGALYRTVMQTGEKTSVEYFSERVDVWLDVHVYPTDEGIALFYQDITDRKGAEFLRDASVRQLRQVLEATTDAVASIDRDWNISFLNRRANELLSPKGDLARQKYLARVPVAAEHNEYLHHFRRAMDEGIAGEFEAFYPEPLNLWLSIQCRPSDDGIVLFFRDITARRQADSLSSSSRTSSPSVQQTALVATWDIEYRHRQSHLRRRLLPCLRPSPR